MPPRLVWTSVHRSCASTSHIGPTASEVPALLTSVEIGPSAVSAAATARATAIGSVTSATHAADGTPCRSISPRVSSSAFSDPGQDCDRESCRTETERDSAPQPSAPASDERHSLGPRSRPGLPVRVGIGRAFTRHFGAQVSQGLTPTLLSTRRTDEEVCYGQYRTNKWDVYINMHISCPYEFPARLPVIPIVRSRKEPLNLEMLCEALAEIIEGLHIAVRPVYTPVAVIEVDIRYDEYAVVIQELRYFSEFLGLEVPHIFEKRPGQGRCRNASHRTGLASQGSRPRSDSAPGHV